MSYPRRPRSVLAQLLEAGKKRRGCDWPEIDRQVGLIKSTRESWLNGNVRDPSLRGVVALADALEIEPQELVSAVLYDELPPWADAYTEAIEVTPEDAVELHGEIAGVLGAKDRATQAARERRRRGSRPS